MERTQRVLVGVIDKLFTIALCRLQIAKVREDHAPRPGQDHALSDRIGRTARFFDCAHRRMRCTVQKALRKQIDRARVVQIRTESVQVATPSFDWISLDRLLNPRAGFAMCGEIDLR
jgi:hypothetical protein